MFCAHKSLKRNILCFVLISLNLSILLPCYNIVFSLYFGILISSAEFVIRPVR